MATAAHKLHMSLKERYIIPKDHKYMIENRGCAPEELRFYEHVYSVQDLRKLQEQLVVGMYDF